MTRLLFSGVTWPILMLAVAVGCGSSEPAARQDILDQPPEVLYGASTKAFVYEFRAVVRKYGVAGAKRDLSTLLSNFSEYEQDQMGDYSETYAQIWEKLKVLETTLKGSPSKEQVLQAVQEIGKLADKLPGKADPNPAVD